MLPRSSCRGTSLIDVFRSYVDCKEGEKEEVKVSREGRSRAPYPRRTQETTSKSSRSHHTSPHNEKKTKQIIFLRWTHLFSNRPPVG